LVNDHDVGLAEDLVDLMDVYAYVFIIEVNKK
jgi:hypothetical protein